jgi:hypothetical protein
MERRHGYQMVYVRESSTALLSAIWQSCNSQLLPNNNYMQKVCHTYSFDSSESFELFESFESSADDGVA